MWSVRRGRAPGSGSGSSGVAALRRAARTGAGSSGARWAIVDQGLSSASNLLLVATVARVSDVASFGRFSLVYVIYGLALGSLRAGGGDVLLLRVQERERSIEQECRRLLGIALWLGTAVGVIIAGGQLASGGDLDSVTLALALVLPALVLQDALRYCFFALSSPRRAALNDLVWLSVQLGLTAVLFVLPIRVDPQLVVLAWGAGALTSAGIGCLAADLTPIVSGARRWLREDRRRVISFLGDFVMMSGSSYLAIYLVAVFASVRTVAAVRGSAFLFAPLDALFLGIRIFALPALAKAAPSGATGMRRIARVIAVASGVVTALAAVLLAWLPGDVGRVILGATWAVAQPLILVTGIGAAARYVALPAQAGLRALNDTQRIVRLRLKVSGLVLVAAVLGTLAGGAAGAVLGLTLAFTVDALISWRAFRASCREKFAGG